MDTTRKAALTAGLLYLGTFIFSLPAVGLYSGVLDDPTWVLAAGPDGEVLWGSVLEILTALTGIGTAVAVYPIIRRFGPSRALGFVASRTLEAAMIFTGVAAVLAVHTLRLSGGDTVVLATTAGGLVAIKDWTFLLGPGVAAVVNAGCFATVLYQSRLVPRWIPTLGLIGAPLLAMSLITTLFGGWEQASPTAFVFVMPIAVWELAVGTYMTVKGFRSGQDADRQPTGDNPMSSTPVVPEPAR